VQVDLVGSIHRVVSSLHFEEWRLQMTDAINQINLDLPSLPSDRKTVAIQEWIEVVLQMVDGYRSDHVILMANINRLLLLLLPAEAEDIVASNIMSYLDLYHDE